MTKTSLKIDEEARFWNIGDCPRLRLNVMTVGKALIMSFFLYLFLIFII